MKAILRVLQKLLKYVNVTDISTLTALVARRFLLVIISFNLYDSKTVRVAFGSSLENKNKLLDVFE